MIKHYTAGVRQRNPKGKENLPRLRCVRDVVSTRVWRALRVSHQQLETAHIRHALVGGLAVGAYGWPRGTKDVDYIVGVEAALLDRCGVPTGWDPAVQGRVGGVVIDRIPAWNDSVLAAEIVDVDDSVGIPIISVAGLFYMKIQSPRDRDRTDLIELVKAGVDVSKIAAHLDRRQPTMVHALRDIVEQAEFELGAEKADPSDPLELRGRGRRQ